MPGSAEELMLQRGKIVMCRLHSRLKLERRVVVHADLVALQAADQTAPGRATAVGAVLIACARSASALQLLIGRCDASSARKRRLEADPLAMLRDHGRSQA
jgi:hypothetical protein